MKVQTQPIVIYSKLTLLRNFVDFKFPENLDHNEREKVFHFVKNYLNKQKKIDLCIALKDLEKFERQALYERWIIESNLIDSNINAHIFCGGQTLASILVNDENHLTVQALSVGLQLNELWKQCNTLDNKFDDSHYAFSKQWGYLTANPNETGTGLKIAVVLHLPGLVENQQIENLAQALQQIGFRIKSDERFQNSNNIFSLSNQYTLGVSEEEEIERITQVVEVIIDQELVARKIFQENYDRFLDKLGRVYGVLKSGYLLSEVDAMEMLSWMRLAADLQIINEKNRSEIDQLMINIQPGNLRILGNQAKIIQSEDGIRAERVRQLFHHIGEPKY